MQREKSTFTGIDKGGLSKTWLKEYTPIVTLALQSQPLADLATQVDWCVAHRQARRGLTTSTKVRSSTPPQTRYQDTVPDGDPSCPHKCQRGVHYPSDSPSGRWCWCTGLGNYPPLDNGTQVTHEPADTDWEDNEPW
jgi:hypothetical protein